MVLKIKKQEEAIELDSSELFMTEISSKTTTDSQDKEVGNKDQENINETEAKKKKTSTENIIDKLHSIDILIHWQENIEKQIPEILRKLSDQTNCILHEGEILAKKIPQKVLEAATKMESENTPVGGRPNLLSLLVEAEDAEEVLPAESVAVAVNEYVPSLKVDNVIEKSKDNPQAIDEFINSQAKQLPDQLLTRVRSRKQELEKQANRNSFKSSLRTGISSLLLAVGYIMIGWTGLKNMGIIKGKGHRQNPAR